MRDTYRETALDNTASIPRILFSVLSLLAAIGVTAALTLQISDQWLYDEFVAHEFFAYFSFQQGFGLVIVLVASGIYGLQSARDTLALSAARAAFVMYSIVAGSTYFVLTETGIADPRPVGPMLWPMIVMNFVIPVYLGLEWLLNSQRAALPWWTFFTSLSYPAVWFVITLIRGEVTGWYPFELLNPSSEEASGSSFLFMGATAALFFLVSLSVMVVNRIHVVLRRSSEAF